MKTYGGYQQDGVGGLELSGSTPRMSFQQEIQGRYEKHSALWERGYITNLMAYRACKLKKLKKKKISSKSFGKKVTKVYKLEEAVSTYVARACEKLRSQNSRAGGIHVFLRTSPFIDIDK